MKIYELTNIPQSYIATVRVVINGAVSIAKTTITANNQQPATSNQQPATSNQQPATSNKHDRC